MKESKTRLGGQQRTGLLPAKTQPPLSRVFSRSSPGASAELRGNAPRLSLPPEQELPTQANDQRRGPGDGGQTPAGKLREEEDAQTFSLLADHDT